MTQRTVLLTCVGGDLAVASINSLKRSSTLDVRVVGVDADPTATGRGWVDAFHQVPAGDDDGYVHALLDIARHEGVEVVVPGSDEEALAISRSLHHFDEVGIACSVAPAELAGTLRNKADTFDLLTDAGVDLGEYRRVSIVSELVDAATALGYPEQALAVKPAAGRGGRGVWLVREGGLQPNDLWGRFGPDVIDLEDLVSLCDAQTMPELVVMPQLAGPVYDVDVLTDRSELHYLVPRRRMNPRGIPFQGCIVENAGDVRRFADSIRRVLSLRCLYDLDIMLDAEGTPRLLEVNPRLSASAVASVDAGVPLLECLARMLLGLEVPRLDIRYETRVRPYVGLTVDYA